MGRLTSSSRIGVEFASGGLRVVSLSRNGSPTIEHAQALQTETDSLALEGLQTFVHRVGAKGAPTVFSVPSDLAAIHWIRIAHAAEGDLTEIAAYKLRDQFPLGTAGTAIGVIPMRRVEGDQVDAMVVAIPKSVVSERALILESVGLKAIGCEIEAQSLLRIANSALEHSGALVDQMSMTLVDIGLERTRLIVVQDSRLQFVRTVKFGANRLVQQIAEYLGVDLPSAQALLDQRSTALLPNLVLELDHRGQRVSIDVSPAMVALFKELRRLLTYFRTLRQERSYSGLLERLLLSGELVSTQGLAEVVGKTIGMRVLSLNPLEQVRLAVQGPELTSLAATPTRFAIATGLALSPYHDPNQKEKTSNARSLDHAAAA